MSTKKEEEEEEEEEEGVRGRRSFPFCWPRGIPEGGRPPVLLVRLFGSSRQSTNPSSG